MPAELADGLGPESVPWAEQTQLAPADRRPTNPVRCIDRRRERSQSVSRWFLRVIGKPDDLGGSSEVDCKSATPHVNVRFAFYRISEENFFRRKIDLF